MDVPELTDHKAPEDRGAFTEALCEPHSKTADELMDANVPKRRRRVKRQELVAETSTHVAPIGNMEIEESTDSLGNSLKAVKNSVALAGSGKSLVLESDSTLSLSGGIHFSTGSHLRNLDGDVEQVSYVARVSKSFTPLHEADQALFSKLGIADFVLLYFTLVTDGVLPHGFFADFVELEQYARRSSDRSMRIATSISDAEAGLLLDASKRRLYDETLSTTASVDQLLVAADLKPKRFRTRLQMASFEGPTARKDAESAERSRWITLMADLLRNTATPMGRLLRENPANSQLLGGGRRAGTLRSRVRVVQKFLSWLTLAHNLAFPDNWRQLIEFMQGRLSEPCVRGALKLVHSSFVLMQEVAGVEEKLTDAALYDISKKELFPSALPGKEPRQAPRLPVVVLAALEENVISVDTQVFWRVLSWWLLLQSWATLRFDDHRGIVPTDINVSESGLVGKLTRSKVSGPDKKLNYRLLIVHSSAYIQHNGWLLSGWKILEKEAPVSS